MEPLTLEKTLENQIRRLEQRIAKLQALSRRFSWVRLVVVILGSIATWIASRLGIGWPAFAASLAVFAIVAFYHRRLEGWIEKFIHWREMKAGQLARLTLNWEMIPEPQLPAKWIRKPAEADLDLTGRHSLHQLVDIATSEGGSQRLAGWLTQTTPNLEQIHQNQGIVRELVPLTRFRERLRLNFRLISKEQLKGEKLLRWLNEEVPVRRLKWVLPASAVFIAVNLTLFWLNITGRIPAYWILSFLLYFIFYYANLASIGEFLEAVVQLEQELSKFRPVLTFLETYSYKGNQNLARLCEPFRNPEEPPSIRLRKVSLVTAAIGLRSNPVLGLLLNLILPWDFFFANLAARYRVDLLRVLPEWLEVWYKLEALISLANFAFLNPEYTFPEIAPNSSPVFQAIGLGHPLIPKSRKIGNDFTVHEVGQINIITGSNMAGKSTFIKTIGINLCLAYAGGPVNAQRFRSLPSRLYTCIHISDSVTDGYSYFYAEVTCLKGLLEEINREETFPLLFLIDEIFRGTNNRERLIGSRSYLKSMIGENVVGFLATHDLELASLADQSPSVVNFHFRDEVLDRQLAFDYKIRPGPSTTTNALKIMGMEGLPVDHSELSSTAG